jgi:hypothetical protein
LIVLRARRGISAGSGADLPEVVQTLVGVLTRRSERPDRDVDAGAITGMMFN